MRLKKTLLLLLVVFGLPALCALAEKETRPAPGEKADPSSVQPLPIRSYLATQNTHEAVELDVTYLNDEVGTCVLEVGKGTVSLCLSDGLRFDWDGKTGRATIEWNGGFSLRYVPAISADELAAGAEYADELLFTYYDRYGKRVKQDAVQITGGVQYMMVSPQYGVER